MVLAPKHKRPSTSIRHKKRYGQHRKQTKPYLKTYWPYLPMVFIVGLGLLVNYLWSTNQIGFTGNAASISTIHLLSDTNKERSANYEAPLLLNQKLTVAAQNQANNMVATNYWSTITPSGEQPGALIEQTGYDYRNASENLAYGFNNGEAILASWMSSTIHKTNILNRDYKDVGFGIAHASNFQGQSLQTVVVAVYGQPNSGTDVNTNKTYGFSSKTIVIGSTTNPNILSQRVARIQLITDSNASWSLVILTTLAIGGFVLLVIRHSLFWRRALSRGEIFVIYHPWVDLLIVAAVTSAFVLTRSAGNIL